MEKQQKERLIVTKKEGSRFESEDAEGKAALAERGWMI